MGGPSVPNEEFVKHCVALYRKPSYSPNQHLANDTAIMDAVAAELAAIDWRIDKVSEAEAESGEVPPADLYLNMCQGIRALDNLLRLEGNGAIMVNRPSSALACHRHRLVRRLAGSGLDFPETVIVSTTLDAESAAALGALRRGPSSAWVKRGDVHAERTEDVVKVAPEGIVFAVRDFAARGIGTVAVQAHVPGSVIKFYGVAEGGFFRYYGSDEGLSGPLPEVDEERLRTLAFAAARRLGLQVFGGDVAVPSPDRPVLIDINDWPSFAPFRAEAAGAIASYLHQLTRMGAPA